MSSITLCSPRCGVSKFVRLFFVLIFLIGLQLFIISHWMAHGKKRKMAISPRDILKLVKQVGEPTTTLDAVKRVTERNRATLELAKSVGEREHSSSAQPPELAKNVAEEMEKNFSSMPSFGRNRASNTSSKFPLKDDSETKGVSNRTTTHTNKSSIKAQQEHITRTVGLPLCPLYPKGLVGKISINMTVHSFQSLETMFKQLGQGGHYKPPDCQSRHKVAIVVPYREREMHLKVFLNHMHPFLQRQQLEYRIYVVEQAGSNIFNRAILMNIGFTEAMKQDNYDCFVFHDVDLLPEDDRTVYSCPEQPRHLSAAVDKFGYKEFYPGLIGGAIQLRTEHFRLVNGFSNKYWGRGGEDDDLLERIKASGLRVIRYPLNIARYKMVKHPQDKLNPSNPKRYVLLSEAKKRFKQDGLNDLTYDSLKTESKKPYTWIYVRVNETKS